MAAGLALFQQHVGDLVKRAPVTCGLRVAAVDVARCLSREGVGSVVVVGDDGAPVGIVTDRDLRRRVVADAADPRTIDAASIMSAPLVTIRPGAFAFEAVLEMTRRRIRHLVVVDEGGRVVGVVSSRDVLVLSTTHPVTLAREIGRAVSLDALADHARRITQLVGQLVDEGGAAHDIGQMVAELNDRLVLRVLALTLDELEAGGEPTPPVPWCWIALGSEARREQTLRTDQDNALIYGDLPAGLDETAARFYRRFAEQAVAGLVKVGFPPCPGGVMASNPRWCQPLAAWRDDFHGWMTASSSAHVLEASIHFDLRPIAGAPELAAALSGLVRAEAPQRPRFLEIVARDVVSRPVPLTLFGNVRVPRHGAHPGAIDVKGAGNLQLVGAARLLALQHGLGETNTIERFRAAAAAGVLDPAEIGEITDAFQHLQRLRLRHQLARLERDETPDNLVAVDALSHSDVVLFRDALQTVRKVQGIIRERFATDFVP
jgi:CBS domain-containing protein